MSRSRLPRLVQSLAAAAVVVAAGLFVSTAGAVPTPASAPAPAPASRLDTSGPRWIELSAAHRKVLAPLANDWNALDSRSKERWVDVAGRFPKMPPDEQARANQRMVAWSHMSVAERMQARNNFQETRGVSKAEREERWKAYQALPEEEKRKLAAKRAAAAPASAASGGVAVARRRAPPPLDIVQPKNNVIAPVRSAAAGSAPSAAPQRPGVTTTLLTRRASPPAHQRDGAPKIAVGPNAVDRKTLLPKHTTVAAAGPAASASASLRR